MRIAIAVMVLALALGCTQVPFEYYQMEYYDDGTTQSLTYAKGKWTRCGMDLAVHFEKTSDTLYVSSDSIVSPETARMTEAIAEGVAAGILKAAIGQ